MFIPTKHYFIGISIVVLLIVGYFLVHQTSYDAGYSEHSMVKYNEALKANDTASKEYISGVVQYQNDMRKQKQLENRAKAVDNT